jgi:CO dehydrogenase/acetyl-CoA synthase gamma subunit (corrinoid Fe-S protein)
MLTSIAMQEADLYLTKIDICRYCPADVSLSCKDFTERWAAGKVNIEDCTFLTPGQAHSFKLVLEARKYLPSVPLLTVPQPVEAGLFPINEPDEGSLVIVSGNNRLTFEVLATIWAQGVTPAYFLLVDCLGNTVDMAMVYGDFTPMRLAHVLKTSGLESKVKHRQMIVPGLTAPLADEFAATTNWEIEVGPVCAVELPLFLGDRWVFSNRQK